VTGTVDFESNGDREVGVGFTIMNWASSDGYVTLGNWGKDSGLVYEDGAEASIVYATEDNSSPPDIILPSCNTDDIIPTVAEECSSAGKRAVIYAIKTNPETGDDVCEGGVPKPANKDLDCEYTPTDSSTGVLAVLLGIVGAGICALWTIWVLLNFNTKVIKVSQPEFCVSFATAAAILSASNLLMVGPNTDTMCLLRPWIFN
ncbi:hypothetical protein TeGR_g10963, partial [Tetraparma gracilis]